MLGNRLLKMKAMAAHPKDLLDIEYLEKVRNDQQTEK